MASSTGDGHRPPDLGLSWPSAERLVGTTVVLTRPDPALASAVHDVVADPVPRVDGPHRNSRDEAGEEEREVGTYRVPVRTVGATP